MTPTPDRLRQPRTEAKLSDRMRVTLRHIRDSGYQPMYNGRPSCPFCYNFVDGDETHQLDCPLLAIEDEAASPVPAPTLDVETKLREARATIEALSGDAADLIAMFDEAAALRTALAHVLVRTHDSGCGSCDAARALLTSNHELPSHAAKYAALATPDTETPRQPRTEGDSRG